MVQLHIKKRMTTYFSSETIQTRRQRSNILEYIFESLLCVRYCLVLDISSEHNKDGQNRTHMKPGVMSSSCLIFISSVLSVQSGRLQMLEQTWFFFPSPIWSLTFFT